MSSNKTNTLDIKVFNSKKDKKFKLDEILQPYSNTFIVARKKSGKTNLLINLVLKCLYPDTNVVLVSNTLHNDQTYDILRKQLKAKNIKLKEYDELPLTIDELLTIKEDEVKERPKTLFDNLIPHVKNVKKPESDLKYIIILDDLGDQLRNKKLNQFLKTNRHYKSKVFMSSQFVKDLLPSSIYNLNHVILGSNLSEESINHILDKVAYQYDKDEFFKKYKDMTDSQFSFAKLDTDTNELSKLT